MVSASRIEGTHNLSAGVRRTIQSIKEIVGNHSDADIYVTLKETNMDPNETAQKLLYQDPFHEVKRKRDKKKEVISVKDFVPIKPRKSNQHIVQGVKANTHADSSSFQKEGMKTNTNTDRGSFQREGMKTNTHTDRSSFRRAGFVRNHVSVRSRQFRVVRDSRFNRNDNKFNQNGNRSIKPPAKNSVHVTTKEPLTSSTSEKSSAEASETLKSLMNVSNDSKSQQVKGVSLGGKRIPVSHVDPPVQVAAKPHDSVMSSNSSVIGVYSSSSDPVHIPSLASRPPANIGAIKRAVGAVGVRRHAESKNSAKATSVTNTKDQPSHSNLAEAVPNVSSGRSFNNQHYSRPHQQHVARQKLLRANKEWKPKSSQKPSVTEVGVIGTPKKSSPPAKKSKDLAKEASQLQNKVQTHKDQNVIIAEHIRVSEIDRCRFTFGSLGIESDVSQSSGFEGARRVEESHVEPLYRLDDGLSVSPPESSTDEPSGSKKVELVDDRVHSSGSVSPDSGTESEPQPTDRLESSSPQNMDNYTSIGLDRNSIPSYASSETHQQRLSEVPSCSQAYDSQTGYDISYFRPATDESLRGQVLEIPQEGFSSHVASVPATTIPLVQQQAASVAQMYPQVHLPQYANLMPYRQFVSPVYVPPMVIPGYSNNPTCSPHPSTGSSYLLMPGANSAHVTANGLKYAIPQYKSVQASTPTGFGNFTSPTGYALRTPGIVGSGSGLEDSSRIKYKDGNVYVPNPQGEMSEHWMNPRDISSMQTASYYNMSDQSPHPTYLPSHAGHTSFNAAQAQSSHMQFPGLYLQPPQAAALANPHHMGPAIGGNVGVGAQLGGYQQQAQLSWTGNF